MTEILERFKKGFYPKAKILQMKSH